MSLVDAEGQIIPRVGVLVGIRFSRLVTPEWAIGLATQNFGMGVNVAYVPIHCHNPKTGSQGPPRDYAAEAIVQSAIDADVPFIMFVDDDVELPFGACRHLMQTLASAEPDVMMVGGIYTTKQDHPEPIVFQDIRYGTYWRWKKNTVFPAELLGLGCSLWKTEVFKKIPKPWFRDIDTEKMSCTDDAFFFGKMKLRGFKALADAYVLPTHWDYDSGKGYQLPKDSFPMQVEENPITIDKGLPEGWTSPEELEWLSNQAKARKRIVEVGSYLGRSTIVLAKSTTGEVWALDNFRADDIKVPDKETIFERFSANTAPYENIRVIKMNHEECFKLPVEWLRGSPEEKPDMVFIDGDHSYAAVKRDLQIWKARIAPGGLLCGHDLSWPGVEQALQEECPNFKRESGDIWSYAVAA